MNATQLKIFVKRGLLISIFPWIGIFGWMLWSNFHPISIVCFAILAIATIVGFIILSDVSKKSFQHQVEELGFEVLPSFPSTSTRQIEHFDIYIRELSLLSFGQTLHAKMDDGTITLCQLYRRQTKKERRGKHKRVLRQVIAILTLPNLRAARYSIYPRDSLTLWLSNLLNEFFDCRWRGIMDKWRRLRMLKSGGFNVVDDTDFSKNFCVFGENESEVRPVFTPSFISGIRKMKRRRVEVCADVAVMVFDDERLDSENIHLLLSEGSAFAKTLLGIPIDIGDVQLDLFAGNV